jgi:polar amino acid transport system substrate-binding protein
VSPRAPAAGAGALLLFAAAALAAPASAPLPDRELVVGVFEAPPWAMKEPSGQWRGVTVDLWKEIASDLKLRYRFQEGLPDAILDGISQGTVDTAAGPFAATLGRERRMDFTHSYETSGIGIAVRRSRDEDRWLAVVEALSTPTAWRLYIVVAVLTFLAGAVLWLLERRRNTMFSGDTLRGLGSGFWWAGVTTVGVGYGDKVPITFWGRLIALFWMFVSLILITALTAFVTAKLALAELGQIHDFSGLRGIVSASVEGSAATDLLRRKQLSYRLYPSTPAALAALLQGDVKAVVQGDVILRYYAERDPQKRLDVLGAFDPQNLAFPLPDGGPYRDRLNAALRRIMAGSRWQDLKDRYLGEEVGAVGR